MLTIKCSGCKSKIFKYVKYGKGKVIYCYKDRIRKDYSKKVENKYRCRKCGKVIGIDDGGRIKMKQGYFITSGFKI